MTRVAVIGTSNIGAIRSALPEIAATYPSIDVTTYGLPGARFDTASVDAVGCFGPDPADRKTAKLSARINGAARIDLTMFDAVLVIGDTLGMPATLHTALSFDIVDWPNRTDRPLLSLAAFEAAMREAIDARVAHLARQTMGIAPLYAALAPYPTTAVVPKGPLHQQPYASMAHHPEAARIERLFRHHLSTALAACGITFVPQPADTIAQPFLTEPAFGEGAMDFRTEGHVLDDHRHMNASFGASLFRALAVAIDANPPGQAAQTAALIADQ